jgi:hypothetical protein
VGKLKSKSKTFAVIMTQGEQLGVKFLWMVKEVDSDAATLEENNHLTPWALKDQDSLIELLVKGGMTVRFYDPEEKQWLEHSLLGGYNAAPGSRDGQYSTPTLDEFKRDYLQTN